MKYKFQKVIKFTIISIFFVFLSFTCSHDISGNSTQTGNPKIIAMLFYPDGSPASGVHVKIFKVNDTTGTSVSEQFTDSYGKYSLKELAIGTYNVYAEIDSLVAFQDSISVLTDTILIENDTLETPTSLTAIVGLQSDGLLSVISDLLGDFLSDLLVSASVQVLGTGISTNVNEEGYFTLERMAVGDFTLKISTTEKDCATTYERITLDVNSPDTLTDTLWLVYTGNPDVERLRTEYCTLNDALRLYGASETDNYHFKNHDIKYGLSN